jgi:ribonuclease VapC
VIVIDTSIVVAILLHEPERERFFDRIADGLPVVISAVSVLEAGIVMRAKTGPDGVADVFALLEFLEADVRAFDAAQSSIALDAFQRFGKGVNPSTRLNFGDCAVYALAKALNCPLLFKGADFQATDLSVAL